MLGLSNLLRLRQQVLQHCPFGRVAAAPVFGSDSEVYHSLHPVAHALRGHSFFMPDGLEHRQHVGFVDVADRALAQTREHMIA